MATTAELAVSPAEAGAGGGYLSPRPDRGEERARGGLAHRGLGVTPYRKRPESELARMSDEELIGYLVAARRADDLDEAKRALGIFCFRRFDDLKRRAWLKVGNDADAEELAMETLKGVLEAVFDGVSPGEAFNLMRTILARRIADFHRDRERKPQPGQLPEDQDDEERKAPDAAVSKDDKDAVWVTELIEREYEKLRSDHKLVVDLRVFARHSSKETAEIVNERFPGLDTPMTATNVDKIASRFREVMRGELEGSG